MPPSRNAIGKQGEAFAQAYLCQQGYSIIATNWACRTGELDIIAQYGASLVFVEVKTRATANTDDALAGFSLRKRNRLLSAIYTWLDAHQHPDEDWRFDLIAVAIPRGGQPRLDHWENALEW